MNRELNAASRAQDKALNFSEYGHRCLGPILYGFASWIGQTAMNQGLEHIYFLARDGYNVEKAYNIIAKNHNGWPKGSYLYASRRSFYGPLLASCKNYEEAIEIISDRSSWTPLQFVEAMGLNSEALPDWVDPNMLVYRENLRQNKVFRRLFDELKPFIDDVSNAEYEALYMYLEQEGFLSFCNAKVGIVDIGWNGSMQRSLTVLLQRMFNGHACKLFGMYLGLTIHASGLKDAAAYWFDERNSNVTKKISITDPVTPFKGLLELFFSNSEGSTNHFELNTLHQDAKAVPILSAYEYSGTKELEEENQGLKVLRNAALNYVIESSEANTPNDEEEYSEYVDDIENVTPEDCLKPMKQLGLHPSLDEADFFGDLLFEDGAVAPLAKPQKLTTYFKHPQNIKIDFLQSRWKVGFLKRLFKFPFDYSKVYNFLLTYRNR